MSNVLRSTTFQLEFNGNDGITGVKTFTRAVRDADAVTEELNKTLGENATVTYKTVRSKKELAQEARNTVTQFERSSRKVEKLTEHYRHMSNTVGKTADEIEVLNAVQSLGANATKQQQEQVADAVRQYQMLRSSVGGTNGSLRDFRGVMQNAGWQVQDTVVQLQMGTDMFIVLSQQGSQIASAFGPTGAIVGAFIALAGVVGGTLFTSLQSAAEKTKDLEEANKSLSDWLSISEDGVVSLSDKYERLARVSQAAADAQLELSRIEAGKALSESAKLVKSAMDDVFNGFGQQDGIEAFGRNTIRELGQLENYLSSDFIRVFDQLEKSVTTENLNNAIRYLNDIRPFKNTKDDVDALKKALVEQLIEVSKNEEILKKTENGWKDLTKGATGASDEIVKSFEREAKALGKQTETIEQEYLRRRQIILDFVNSGKESEESATIALANLQKWKTEELKKESDKRLRAAEEEARKLARIYERRERERRRIEQGQIDVQSGDDPVTAANRLLNANLTTLVEQRKQLKEDEYAEIQRIDKLIEGEVLRHNSIIAGAELQAVQNQIQVFSMAASQMQGLADLMATGVADVEAKTKEMSDFQKAMFVISQSIAAVQALVNGISLGMSLAALFPLAAPAMISFGTGLGVASSTAIMATTFAGAFDNGGQIMSNEAGIVSEYGAELVNGALVMGAASVTSREDTAKLLNNDKSVSLKVEINNQIANASYDVQQIDEETVRIIAKQEFNKNIDEGVSNVLSNGNSKSAKSLRKNYDTKRRIQ